MRDISRRINKIEKALHIKRESKPKRWERRKLRVLKYREDNKTTSKLPELLNLLGQNENDTVIMKVYIDPEEAKELGLTDVSGEFYNGMMYDYDFNNMLVFTNADNPTVIQEIKDRKRQSDAEDARLAHEDMPALLKKYGLKGPEGNYTE